MKNRRLIEPLDIRSIDYNPIGRRNLTKKDKDRIRRKARKPKYYEIDHKKPVALHKTYSLMDGRIDIRNKDGSLPKHSYDKDRNLQALSPRQHKKKTKSDINKIRAKRYNNPYGNY